MANNARSLRILSLLFHPPLTMGGAERRFSRIQEFWKSSGCEVWTLEPEPAIVPESVQVYCLVTKPGTWAKLVQGVIWIGRSLLAGWRLPRPDVILCANNDLFTILPGFLLAKASRTPLAVVVHHFDLMEIMNPQMAQVKGARMTHLGTAYRMLKSLAIRLAISLTRKAAVVFCVNPSFLSLFPRAILTGNTIDLERFENISGGPLLYDCCYVGLISREKGILDLLDLWKEVQKQRPNATLSLVGTDMLDIGTRIRKKGLGKSVVHLGPLKDEEVVGVLKASKLFVTASKSEGWGIAIAEALASGLPVVCPDTEPLRNAWSGVAEVHLVDNQRESVKTILRILESESSGRAPVKMPDFLSWEALAKKELDVLESLVL